MRELCRNCRQKPIAINYYKDGKPHYRFLYSDIVDGELLSEEVNFCHLWGKEIYADTKHKISNFGNFEFAGTVGARSILR